MNELKGDADIYRVCAVSKTAGTCTRNPDRRPVASFNDKAAALNYAMCLARGRVAWHLLPANRAMGSRTLPACRQMKRCRHAARVHCDSSSEAALHQRQPAGLQPRPLRGKHFVYRDTRGRPITGCARHPAHPQARYPARLRGRVDLPARERPPPGHRPRCARPQAISLSPAVARASRRARNSIECWSSAARLPRIRRRVAKDLRLSGLPQEKVLATIVRLLECTLIRVGNEEYAQRKRILRAHHVCAIVTSRVKSGALVLEFRGKSGSPAARAA